MMQAMLIGIGVYLAGCYAYGLWLLAKLVTGRMLASSGGSASLSDLGFVEADAEPRDDGREAEPAPKAAA